MSRHTLNIDGANLIYTIDGDTDAPPIIMVHGWGSFKGVWRTTIPTLKEHYRCIAVDLIGFGDSDIPRNVDVSIPTQAKRIIKLIDSLGYDKVTLMGHSMGGQTVLYLASLMIPERIHKLVVVDGVVHGKVTPKVEDSVILTKIAYYFPLWFATARLWSSTRLYASIYCSHWFYDWQSIPLDFWREERYRIIQPNSHRSMYPAYQSLIAHDMTPHLSKITAPTLTLFGKQDNVVPVESAHILDKHVPHHQLVLFDKCGHFPMYEHPEAYLDAIQTFLADNSSLE